MLISAQLLLGEQVSCGDGVSGDLMKPIHIVNSADANYVPHVGAMLHSLFERNPEENICFHFLHSKDMPLAELQSLMRLCELYGADFQPLEVNAQLLDGFPLTERYPVEAWYRVLLPTLLLELDKVLWLDADTLVLDSIRPLWDMNLGNSPLAACPNPLLYDCRELPQGLDIVDRTKYFNSGVMLLNLRQMRRDGYEEALRGIGQRYFDHIRFADQDIFNVAYINRYIPLSMEWNVLTHNYVNVPEARRVFGKKQYREALSAPKIIHFTGSFKFKPWSYKCGHPCRDRYLYHRAKAGWPLRMFPDKSARNWVVRNLPLRLKVIIEAFFDKRFGEMMSYIRGW